MNKLIILAVLAIMPFSAMALSKEDRIAIQLENADPLMTEDARIDLCVKTLTEIHKDSFYKSSVEEKFIENIKVPGGFINNKAFDDYTDLANLIKWENYVFFVKCMN